MDGELLEPSGIPVFRRQPNSLLAESSSSTLSTNFSVRIHDAPTPVLPKVQYPPALETDTKFPPEPCALQMFRYPPNFLYTLNLSLEQFSLDRLGGNSPVESPYPKHVPCARFGANWSTELIDCAVSVT